MRFSGWSFLLHGVAAVLSVGCGMLLAANAQTFTSLAILNGTDGATPGYGSMAQATNGTYYGATLYGGKYAEGTIFQITPDGTLTDLYSFCSFYNCADGAIPYGPILGSDGNLYGVTFGGGSANEYGTVYKLTLGGEITKLYTFCPAQPCSDGEGPVGLVQAGNGNFYGVTTAGGTFGYGTLFELTSTGKFRLLHTFCSEQNCTDGGAPVSSPIQARNGNLYGTIEFGGSHGEGVVYEITLGGSYRVLYNFCSQANCADGSDPFSGLVQDAAGNLYGTTVEGGNLAAGVVFQITPKNEYSVLHNFDGIHGGSPVAALTLANDGDLYGTTIVFNDEFGDGNIFKVTPEGKYTSFYGFCSTGYCTTGNWPLTTLLQATNGTLYGATGFGGTDDDGAIFSLSNNLSPLVETVPTMGKIGTRVIILGDGLTGSSAVTFNGVAAAFSVESDTYISATVPEGATTGTVSVATPTGTLNSNPQFAVTK